MRAQLVFPDGIFAKSDFGRVFAGLDWLRCRPSAKLVLSSSCLRCRCCVVFGVEEVEDDGQWAARVSGPNIFPSPNLACSSQVLSSIVLVRICGEQPGVPGYQTWLRPDSRRSRGSHAQPTDHRGQNHPGAAPTLFTEGKAPFARSLRINGHGSLSNRYTGDIQGRGARCPHESQAQNVYLVTVGGFAHTNDSFPSRLRRVRDCEGL